MNDHHADIYRLANGHPLADDTSFLEAIARALAVMGPDARRPEIIAEAATARVRDMKAEHAAAIEQARRDGAAAERERIAAILRAPEAEGRRAVAEALAFDSAMPAGAAIEALRSAPKAPGWASAATLSDEQVARAEAALAGRRARDAAGGLVLADGAELPVGATAAIISGGPADDLPKPGASKTQALWKEALTAINRGASAGAQPAPKPGA